jgi:hypothetical protein
MDNWPFNRLHARGPCSLLLQVERPCVLLYRFHAAAYDIQFQVRVRTSYKSVITAVAAVVISAPA